MAGPGGCREQPRGPFTLLTEPVSVVASRQVEDPPLVYRLQLRGRDQDRDHEWVVRTTLHELESKPRTGAPGILAILKNRVAWHPPYLYLREDNAHGNAWRATVDHVFRISGSRVQRVGTVSAHTGPPGSQRRDDRFVDIYDRLEFTFLTSHANAPRFHLWMEEKDGRFTVDLPRTWQEGQPALAEATRKLGDLADHPDRLATEADRRAARGLALFCLAFTRYCDRDTEYRASLDLARRALGEVEDLLEEARTVNSGELAPSLEEVFRATPALLNLFKESPPLNREDAGFSAPVPPPLLPPDP